MPRPLKAWRLTDEQSATVDLNRMLATYYAGKNYVRHRLDYDDAVSVCYLALCRAVCSHDPERSALSTYSWAIMERCMRRESHQRSMIVTPRHYRADVHARIDPVFTAQAERIRGMHRAGHEALRTLAVTVDEDPSIPDYVLAVLASVEPAKRALLERLVMRGETEATIAAERGVCKQAIGQAKNRALAVLRRNLRGKR